MTYPHGVWVNFHVNQKHSVYMEPDRYQRFVGALNPDLPTDLDQDSLDEVANFLDRADEDVLIELSSEDTWSDTTAASFDELVADSNDYSHHI